MKYRPGNIILLENPFLWKAMEQMTKTTIYVQWIDGNTYYLTDMTHPKTVRPWDELTTPETCATP